MKNLFFLLALSATLLTTLGCGNDDDGDGITPDLCALSVYNERVLESLESLQVAVTAYSNDPSTANCEAYRSAAQDYLDTIREFDTCADIISRQEYQESLAEAEMELANLQC